MYLLKLIFSLNLVLLSLDHLITGSFAIFFPNKAIKSLAVIYGTQIPPTQEYFVIMKPWGALGIFAGLVGLLPVYDSKRYIGVLMALVVLLMIRLVYRLKVKKDTEKFLKLSVNRNLHHVGLIVVCASLIVAQLIFI